MALKDVSDEMLHDLWKRQADGIDYHQAVIDELRDLLKETVAEMVRRWNERRAVPPAAK